jgi:hypothetical protein
MAHRIDTATAQKDKFGAGKNGFTRGNPQTGEQATALDDDYFDMIQEELIGIVEAANITPNKAKHDQLLTALKALFLDASLNGSDIADKAAFLSNLGLQFLDSTASVSPGAFTSILSPDGKLRLVLANNGDWGVQRSGGNAVPLPLSRGGTGATDAAGAIKNLGIDIALDSKQPKDDTLTTLSGKDAAGIIQFLGLGSAATRNVASSTTDADINKMIFPGFFGLGGSAVTVADPGVTASQFNGFLCGPGSSGAGSNFRDQIMPILNMSRLAGRQSQMQVGIDGIMATRINNLGTWSSWVTMWSTANTTRAADGTLKAASPVVKIFADGQAETNSESEGVTVRRQAVGEYLIDGCIGLNADAAWGGVDGGFDIPTDRNKQPLIWIDYEVKHDGSILVKTYHRTYPDAPIFARNEREGFVSGDPIDIPSDQFVSVRVEMPSDSIWNLNQTAAQKDTQDEG